MSWVSENKFLSGFGAVMLVGVGTLGWLTYSAMDKSDAATAAFDSANAQLRRLREAKPSLTQKHLEELLAQQKQMSEKIDVLQTALKKRVLPVEPITKGAFQDKLKDTVALISSKAAAKNVERPKDFYLGFGEYQSKPPDDKAAPLLARELRAIEMVMNVLISTGNLELEEFQREPLPEEGQGKAGDPQGGGRRRASADRGDRGLIERNGLKIKFTSNDDALRKVLTELANHQQQLFIIRNVAVQNKVQDSPPRAGGAAPAPVAPDVPPPAPDASATPAPATPAPVPAAPAAVTPPPAGAARGGNESTLAYIFGTEKITSTIDIEVLNIEEPKPKSEKPDPTDKKAGKTKEK